VVIWIWIQILNVQSIIFVVLSNIRECLWGVEKKFNRLFLFLCKLVLIVFPFLNLKLKFLQSKVYNKEMNAKCLVLKILLFEKMLMFSSLNFVPLITNQLRMKFLQSYKFSNAKKIYIFEKYLKLIFKIEFKQINKYFLNLIV